MSIGRMAMPLTSFRPVRRSQRMGLRQGRRAKRRDLLRSPALGVKRRGVCARNEYGRKCVFANVL